MTLILALTQIRLAIPSSAETETNRPVCSGSGAWDKVLVTLGGRYDWADQSSLTVITVINLNVTTKSSPGVVGKLPVRQRRNALLQLQ